MLRAGDYVTRKKYGNDILFVIDKVVRDTVYLKGVDVRLYADCSMDDLTPASSPKKKKVILKLRTVNTEEYFYVPGKILHLDSDKSYLNKCLDYYKVQNVKAYGYLSSEKEYRSKIISLIEKYNPDVVILTGHDAHYNTKKDGKDYKNSDFFIDAVKEIRKKYNDIIIFAGACQSDYDGIIKSGATFASSPKHVNIHALDPAIIGSFVALADINEKIDIKNMLSKTHYGSDGVGGLVIKGRMYSGYPRGGN